MIKGKNQIKIPMRYETKIGAEESVRKMIFTICDSLIYMVFT